MSVINSLQIRAMAARTPSRVKLSDKEKEAMFKPWSEMTDFNMKINEAFALLSAIFSHNAFFDCGGQHRSQSSIITRQANAAEQVQHAIAHTSVENRIGETDQHIIFSVKLPSIYGYVAGLRNQPTGEQAAEREMVTQIVEHMFPGFKIDDLPLSDNKVTTAIAARKIAIEEVASIKIDGIPALRMNDWNKAYRGLVTFNLQPYNLYTKGASIATHVSPHMNLWFDIGVKLSIKIPKAYARWATNASGESINMVAFYQLFSSRYMFYNTGRVRGAPPKSVEYNPSQIQNVEKYLAETYEIKERPQTNSEDLCSLPDGRLIWVAPKTSLNVDGVFNSCLEDADQDGFREIDTTALQNRHVYTSWLTNKMIITDAEGDFKVVDLNGARPPSEAALAHMMSQTIGEHIIGINAIAERLEFPINWGKLSAVSHYMDDIRGGVGRWENLIDVPFSSGDKPYDKIVNDAFFDLGAQITSIYERMISANLPVFEQYEIRGYLALVAVYGKKRMQFAQKLNEQSALNRASVKAVIPKLVDMPGVSGVMPHQVRVASLTANNEITAALFDISAGGGKSWTMINDITKLMKEGKIQRPLIVMPRNILGQFAKEITRFTEGNFRPFILSTFAWKSITRSGQKYIAADRNEELDAEIHSVVRLLKGLKKNTILLADYNWLRRDWKEIEILGAKGKVFPHAMMLDRLGVDYVAADESQRIKKLSSSRTQAASVVFANAKYRRLSSGTLLHNTVEDYIGQMAVIEPLALGDIGDLLKAKIKPRTDQSRRELETNITNFSRRVTVRRREWAHLLPIIKENVHPVKMTKRQQKYNDDLMRKALDEFQKDPVLKRLQQTDPDAYERRLEKLMKRKFQPLEVWINAPDSTASEVSATFANLKGVEPEDLLSPKLATIDALIELHLNGGPEPGRPDNMLKPDPNKIIVCGYNVEVSKHIFRESKYAHLGIHFTAGDDAALSAFLSDDPSAPKIMYADYGGMTEGLNGQICSRLICLQSPWTPGMMEQLIARLWRPDVPDKNGEVKYPRKYIWVDYVTTIPSVEVCKTARLIAKQIDNLRQTEESSSPKLQAIIKANERIFDSLQIVKMNLDTIRKYAMESEQTDETKLLTTSFTAYKLVKGWEEEEFMEARARLDKEIFERTGKRVTDKNRAALSMIPVTSDITKEFVPNKALQAHGFATWVDSYTGFNPTSLHLVPLSTKIEDSADDDEDDDEDSESEDEGTFEETIAVEPGDPVLTQYGPGRIEKARKNASIVHVVIPGYSRHAVPLRRFVVLGAENEQDKAALDMMLRRAGKQGLPTIKLDDNQELVPLINEVPEANILEFQKSTYKPPIVKTQTILKPVVVPPQAAPIVRGRGGQVVDTKPKFFIPRQAEESPIVRGRGGAIINQPVVRGRGGAIVEQPRGISRAPGIENDVVVKRGRGRPPMTIRTEIKKPLQTLDMRQKVKEEDLWADIDKADAVLINGALCIKVADEDEGISSVLTKFGFDRLGSYVSIEVKNPGGFKRLLSLLASEYFIPRDIKRQLDNFADIYAEKRQQVAFMKNRELQFHRLWLMDQHKKAKLKNEIHPWPVVDSGRVYLQINMQTCPAIKSIKSMTMPMGVGNKKGWKSEMIMMVKGPNDAKRLMTELEAKHIRFTEKKKILYELSKIK